MVAGAIEAIGCRQQLVVILMASTEREPVDQIGWRSQAAWHLNHLVLRAILLIRPQALAMPLLSSVAEMKVHMLLWIWPATANEHLGLYLESSSPYLIFGSSNNNSVDSNSAFLKESSNVMRTRG